MEKGIASAAGNITNFNGGGTFDAKTAPAELLNGVSQDFLSTRIEGVRNPETDISVGKCTVRADFYRVAVKRSFSFFGGGKTVFSAAGSCDHRAYCISDPLKDRRRAASIRITCIDPAFPVFRLLRGQLLQRPLCQQGPD